MFTEQTSVHRVRFYHPDNLLGIQCMSVDDQNGKLAVGRRGLEEDVHSCFVEIWDIRNSPCIEQKIFESEDEPTLIEAITWGTSGRLFSCGCNGYVNEYDLTKGQIKDRRDISGGPLWCLVTNASRKKIAIGSDDGCISVIGVEKDGFGEVVVIGKMSDRVISIAWMDKADKIVAGSMGIISIYDAKNKRLLEKIEVGKDCVVWSLGVFDDTIITGDSLGFTSFWDSVTGTLNEKYHSHRSDILTMAVSKMGRVYTTGVDPLIAQFDAYTFKPLPPINTHTHDVRAIAVDQLGHIYSGGQDVDLVRTITRPKSSTHFQPDLTDRINFWGNVLSLQYLKKIELFELDTKISGVTEYDPNVELPVKLASINSKRHIIASAINTNWIVYSYYNNLAFLNLVKDVAKIPHPIQLEKENDGVVSRMSFLDEETLALCTATKVYIVSLTDKKITITTIKQFDHRITSMATCSESVALSLSNCELVFLPKGDWKPVNVSMLPSIPTAMSFNPFELHKLFICTSNKTFLKFNLDMNNLTRDSHTNLTRLEVDQYFRGITFLPKSVLINTNTKVVSFEGDMLSLKTVISQYKSVMRVNSVLDQRQQRQLVVVEIPEEQFVNLLPPAFLKKIYGAE